MLLFPVDKILGSAGGLGSIRMCEVQFLLGALGTRVAAWALRRPRAGFSSPLLSELQARKNRPKSLLPLVADSNADTLSTGEPGPGHHHRNPQGQAQVEKQVRRVKSRAQWLIQGGGQV